MERRVRGKVTRDVRIRLSLGANNSDFLSKEFGTLCSTGFHGYREQWRAEGTCFAEINMSSPMATAGANATAPSTTQYTRDSMQPRSSRRTTRSITDGIQIVIKRFI